MREIMAYHREGVIAVGLVLIFALTIHYGLIYINSWLVNFIKAQLSCSDKVSVSVNVFSLSVTIRNIHLNSESHCSHSSIICDSVNAKLFPVPLVTVSNISYTSNWKHPSMWSADDVVSEFNSSRLIGIESTTATIRSRMENMFKKQRFTSWFNRVLNAILDWYISGIRVDMMKVVWSDEINSKDSDCSMLVMRVSMISLSPNSWCAFKRKFSSHKLSFQGLSLTAESSIREENGPPPFINISEMEANVFLPRVLSELMSQQPLREKWCMVKATMSPIVVDLDPRNINAYMLWRKALSVYHTWQDRVKSRAERDLEISAESTERKSEYMAIYSSYIELKNPGKEEKRLSDLQKKCREMENSMSTTSIHHMRALALKWMDSISELASCFAMDDQECKNSASFIEFAAEVYRRASEDSTLFRYIEIQCDIQTIDVRLTSPRLRHGASRTSTPHSESQPSVRVIFYSIHCEVTLPLITTYSWDKIGCYELCICRVAIFAEGSHFPQSRRMSSGGAIVDRCVVLKSDEYRCNVDEIDPMITATIHQDSLSPFLTVCLRVSNALFVNEAETISYATAYLLDIADCMSGVSKFWSAFDDSSLPSTELDKPLPGSIWGGLNMRCDVILINVGCGIRDPQSLSQNDSGVVVLYYKTDLSVVIVSGSRYEAVWGRVTNSELSPFVQTYSEGIKEDELPWFVFSPLPRVCPDGLKDFDFSFLYSLYLEEVNDSRVETDCLGKMYMKRSVVSRSQPFSFNISDQEVNIILNYLDNCVRVYPEVWKKMTLELTESPSKLPPGSEKCRIFLNQLHDRLQVNNISDETISREAIQELVRSSLKHFNLCTSELSHVVDAIFARFECIMCNEVNIGLFNEVASDLFCDHRVAIKGSVPLQLSEYVGANCHGFIANSFRSAHDRSLLWQLLEKETSLRRQTGVIGNTSPVQIQKQLVRLCRDASLARALWDHIITIELDEYRMVPWNLREDSDVGKLVCVEDLWRSYISVFCNDIRLNNTTVTHLKTTTSPTVISTQVVIERTESFVDIKLGSVEWKYMDLLLGPQQPRVYCELTDICVSGKVSHYGTALNMYANMAHGLDCDISGSIAIMCEYFSSEVGTTEPIIEPYVVQLLVGKDEGNGELTVWISDDGQVAINLSATLLQTIASIMLRLSQSHNLSGVYCEEHFQDSADAVRSPSTLNRPETVGTMWECAFVPSFVLINTCGVDLNVDLHLSKRSSDTRRKGISFKNSIKVSSLSVPNGVTRPVHVPWSRIYSTDSYSSVFPTLFMSTKENCDHSVMYTSNLMPLHSFALQDVFLSSRKLSRSGVSKEGNIKKYESGIVIAPQRENISDMEEVIQHSNAMIVRSNVCFDNGTADLLRVGVFTLSPRESDPIHEICIPKGRTRAVPLPYVNDEMCMYSIFDQSGTQWGPTFSLDGVICSEDMRCVVERHILYCRSSMLIDNRSSRTIYDYSIEVVCGFKFINGLPCDVEIKYHEIVVDSDKESDIDVKHSRLDVGDEVVLPVSPESSRGVCMRVINRYDTNSFKDSIQWSPEISVCDMLDTNTKNVTENDVLLPCYFTERGIFVRARKVRDPRRESIRNICRSSSCTITIYADTWIQNNTGLILNFWVKSSHGDKQLIRGSECGCNVFGNNSAVSGVLGGETMSSKGPIISLLDTKSIKVKTSKKHENSRHCSSLDEFENLSHTPPQNGVLGKYSSGKIYVSSSQPQAIRCGNVYLGASVAAAPGLFSRTRIVVITPRYVVQNLSSLHLSLFPLKILRESEIKSLLGVASTDNLSDEGSKDEEQPISQSIRKNSNVSEEDSISRFKIAQNSRDWGAFAVDPIIAEDSDDYNQDEFGDYSRYSSESINDHDDDDLSLKPVVVNTESNTSATFFSFNEKKAFYSAMLSSLSLFYPAVSLKILSNRPPLPDAACGDTNFLSVNILSASGLARSDLIGSSDPICSIIWQGEVVYKTRHINDTLNPVWNETFLIPFHKEDYLSCELILSVFDVDLNSYIGDFLGQVRLTHHDICDDMTRLGETRELKLVSKGDGLAASTYVQGEIKFMLSFVKSSSFKLWSPPINISHPGVEHVTLRCSDNKRHLVEVSIQDSNCARVISLRDYTPINPPAFKVVNRLPDLKVRFRQRHTRILEFPRYVLEPTEFTYYAWDDPGAPRVLEVCVVDEHGVQSPCMGYGMEAVGTDLSPIDVSRLDNSRSCVHVRLIVEGQTRTLEISNPPQLNIRKRFFIVDRANLFSLRIPDIKVDLSGVTLSLIDNTPKEIFSLTLENISLYVSSSLPKFYLCVSHLQLDNLLPDAKYRVALSSSNSGRNSHLHEDYGGAIIPFVEVALIPDSAPSSAATILELLELRVQELRVSVDFTFLLAVTVAVVGGHMIHALSMIADSIASRQESDTTEVKRMLAHKLKAPGEGSLLTPMIFVKALDIQSMCFKFRLSTQIDQDAIPKSAIESTLTDSTISTLLMSVKGITNINPVFSFAGVHIQNAFDTAENLASRVLSVYISQLGFQVLQILGSADIFGDPAGGIRSLGTSVRLFVKQTNKEITGSGPYKAEGVQTLVQGVAGVSFGTTAKVANSLGENLSALSGTTNFKKYMGKKDPDHIGSGIIQAGGVFVSTVKEGVKNVATKPYRGIKQRSVVKTAQGFVLGMSSLALSPVVGVLGATAKLSQGIVSTTHILDDEPVGRLRHPRPLFHRPQLMPLSSCVAYSGIELHLRGGEIFMNSIACWGSKDDEDRIASSYSVIISVQYGSRKATSPSMDLRRQFKNSWSDSDTVIRLPLHMEKDSYARKQIKIKCRLEKRQGKSLPKRQFTFGKCHFHPLDLVYPRSDDELPLALDVDRTSHERHSDSELLSLSTISTGEHESNSDSDNMKHFSPPTKVALDSNTEEFVRGMFEMTEQAEEAENGVCLAIDLVSKLDTLPDSLEQLVAATSSQATDVSNLMNDLSHQISSIKKPVAVKHNLSSNTSTERVVICRLYVFVRFLSSC